MADKYQQLGNAFLEDIWSKRDRGIPIPELKWGPLRHQDVLYLLNHYPFLQIISTEPQFAEKIEPQFITSQSGWVIHDYGDAMSASPGELLYGHYSTAGEEEGGEGGKGTVIHQAFLTAQEMIAIAMQKGWPGVEVVDGSIPMQWAAWMWAEDHQYLLRGYEPDKSAKDKRKRIQQAVTAAEAPTPTGPRRGR